MTKYFLKIHRIESSNDPAVSASEWDGAVDFEFDLDAKVHKDATLKAASDKFSRQQVIPDERRLFLSDSLSHAKQVPAGTVNGERTIMIEKGRATREIKQDWADLWQDYLDNTQVEASGN
jgi:hypothetical protein